MSDRKHALVIQHVPFEGPGAIGTWLTANDYRVQTCHLYRGEALPDVGDIDWLVILGGPMGVADETDHPFLIPEKAFIRQAIELDIPVLGICLGAQLIADTLGAPVTRNAEKEIGWFPVSPSSDHPLAQIFDDTPRVLHWHGDTFAVPESATALLQSEACSNQAFILDERVLGLQFHLEMTADGIASLCLACAGELAPSKWVQDAATLCHARDFEALHQRLYEVLDTLEQASA